MGRIDSLDIIAHFVRSDPRAKTVRSVDVLLDMKGKPGGPRTGDG